MKLECSLKLKIKLPDTQSIIALYFEFENELKFYNLEASWLDAMNVDSHAGLTTPWCRFHSSTLCRLILCKVGHNSYKIELY